MAKNASGMDVPAASGAFPVEADAGAAPIRMEGQADKEKGTAFLNIRSGPDEVLAPKRWRFKFDWTILKPLRNFIRLHYIDIIHNHGHKF